MSATWAMNCSRATVPPDSLLTSPRPATRMETFSSTTRLVCLSCAHHWTHQRTVSHSTPKPLTTLETLLGSSVTLDLSWPDLLRCSALLEEFGTEVFLSANVSANVTRIFPFYICLQFIRICIYRFTTVSNSLSVRPMISY